MLPKTHRLTKKRDFDAVFKRGKSVKADFLFVRALASVLPQSRFGFVVSNKVSPKATVRNKIKRQLRSACAQVLPLLKKRADYVIVSTPNIAGKNFSQIQQAVGEALKKI